MKTNLQITPSSDRLALPGPLRILLVHEEEGALACLWRLAGVFERQFPDLELEWQSCFSSNLHEPSLARIAADRAGRADLVVYCSGPNGAWPVEIREWFESWIAATPHRDAAIGQLIPCRTPPSREAAAHVADLARRGGRTWLGVGHSCEAGLQPTHGPGAWGHRRRGGPCAGADRSRSAAR